MIRFLEEYPQRTANSLQKHVSGPAWVSFVTGMLHGNQKIIRQRTHYNQGDGE